MRRQAAIVLAAILCLTGCGAGEPAAKPAAKTKTSTSQTLPKSQREALKRQAIQTARNLIALIVFDKDVRRRTGCGEHSLHGRHSRRLPDGADHALVDVG